MGNLCKIDVTISLVAAVTGFIPLKAVIALYAAPEPIIKDIVGDFSDVKLEIVRDKNNIKL